MAERDWKSDVHEPAAAGREAFWVGRPVWANPYVGAAARAWKTGWVNGQAELVTRAGECAVTAPEGERKRLLRLHRPEDISPRLGARQRRARVSAASLDVIYSVATPNDGVLPTA